MLDARMLCLAALMGGREVSGYDIKKELERGAATGLYDPSFGSIYPALARLTEEGYLVVRSEDAGRRDRKIYAMTTAGRTYFLRTLTAPLPDEKYRSPFLFAMLFADELPRSRVRAMIDRQIDLWDQKVDAIRDLSTDQSPCAGETFVNGFGLATLLAGLEFLKRHRARVEDAALVDPSAVGIDASHTSFSKAASGAAE